MEGSSVTLTCSSDANPAANYTWYKEDEDSPKASGQIFTITDITAEHGGNYQCEAQNTHGRSEASLHLTVGAGEFSTLTFTDYTPPPPFHCTRTLNHQYSGCPDVSQLYIKPIILHMNNTDWPTASPGKLSPQSNHTAHVSCLLSREVSDNHEYHLGWLWWSCWFQCLSGLCGRGKTIQIHQFPLCSFTVFFTCLQTLVSVLWSSFCPMLCLLLFSIQDEENSEREIRSEWSCGDDRGERQWGQKNESISLFSSHSVRETDKTFLTSATLSESAPKCKSFFPLTVY